MEVLYILIWSSDCSSIYLTKRIELCVLNKSEVLVAQSFPTLCNFMDCSPPGFSAHGILQARILEWVATPSFARSSPTRDQTHISCGSCIASRFFTTELPGKPEVLL